jgi:two-component system, cell cycle sensor histidine kinase and response regulator CckA
MGAATILLVDDDDAIRQVIRSILELSGYRVVDARAPLLALELFAENPEAIDLLITDVVMPGMSGPTLADRLAAVRPELPVLFISGGIDLTPITRGDDRRRTLMKPFEAAVLIDATETLLTVMRR